MEQPTKSAAIATEIRVLLVRKGQTLGWLAGQIGMSRVTLSKRLNGSKAFAIDELERIAVAFDVPLPSLLERAA